MGFIPRRYRYPGNTMPFLLFLLLLYVKSASSQAFYSGVSNTQSHASCASSVADWTGQTGNWYAACYSGVSGAENHWIECRGDCNAMWRHNNHNIVYARSNREAPDEAELISFQ